MNAIIWLTITVYVTGAMHGIETIFCYKNITKRKEKQKMPEPEEEVFYVYCRKCGDPSLCASKEHKEKLEQRNEEPLKGRSLYTCRACIYSWL